MQQTDSRLAKFLSSKPKAIQRTEEELIHSAPLLPGERLPLVMRPAVRDVDLAGWARQNRDRIEELLFTHGGILFTGFGLQSVGEFEQFANAICPELFADYGDLPPEEGGRKVYRSTPYPSDKTILFHNESSHQHRWPMKQFFFCVQAAEEGGETPIVDCRKMYSALRPELLESFAEKDLLYVRNFTDGLDVSWQEFFRTEDRAEVESYCRRAGIEFEWHKDGLRTRQRCPAVTRHPRTGEPLFFNQVQLHHVSCLEPAVRQSLYSIFGEDNLPRNVYYGDGSPIADEVMEEVSRAYWKNAVTFEWQPGDVVLLDNMLTAHARMPYVGPRKIVVAMGEMWNAADLQN